MSIFDVKLFKKRFNFSIPIMAFCMSLGFAFHSSNLDAGGWGKTENVFEYENTTWNDVYFDMNGLYLTASVPNYDGTRMQNGAIYIYGKVEGEGNYMIYTTLSGGFQPPESIELFAKIIEDANPDHIVTIVEPKALGVKYAVDLIPKSNNDKTHWRFLSTHNRIIQMGTDDINGNRRVNFFESMHVH